jgi:hypothetical protein
MIYLLLSLFILNHSGFLAVANTNEAARETSREGLYNQLHLSEKGLTWDVFELAVKGYSKLVEAGKLKNPAILTIVDYSQSSRNKRMYVIDFLQKTVVFQTLVAHGKKTGDEFARYFSNLTGSHQSSLGFFITGKEIMGGTVGRSLLLDGVEKGFNDNARSREIIIHGADYATEQFINRTGRLGRSFGCPSLPPDVIKPVIDVIKEGSCLFIYHNDQNYLAKSVLLH